MVRPFIGDDVILRHKKRRVADSSGAAHARHMVLCSYGCDTRLCTLTELRLAIDLIVGRKPQRLVFVFYNFHLFFVDHGFRQARGPNYSRCSILRASAGLSTYS